MGTPGRFQPGLPCGRHPLSVLRIGVGLRPPFFQGRDFRQTVAKRSSERGVQISNVQLDVVDRIGYRRRFKDRAKALFGFAPRLFQTLLRPIFRILAAQGITVGDKSAEQQEQQRQIGCADLFQP